jgi:hypothetical protein
VGGIETQLHIFITSALDGNFSLANWRFTIRKKAFRTYWIRGWVERVAGLDAVEDREIPMSGIEPQFFGCLLCSLVTILTEHFMV